MARPSQTLDQPHRRIQKCRRPAAFALQPCQQRQQQKQQEQPRVGEEMSYELDECHCEFIVWIVSLVAPVGCGSVSSTSRTAEPCSSRNSVSRGSYLANFTKSQLSR